MSDKTETEAQMAAFAGAMATGTFDKDATGQFAALPPGYTVADLEKWQDRPNRITAKAKFVEVASLAEYVNRFAVPQTMVTANYDTAVIHAVFDGNSTDAPGWQEHHAAYHATIHERLFAWLKYCDKPLSQIEFGLFLEYRAVDVVFPDAASVMEMVMTFDATKKVTFNSSQRLHDGQRQFRYVEENQVTGGVTLPDHFIIFSPIYRGMEPQRIKFMVRYNIVDGKLRFQMEMHDKAEVMRAAFDKCVDAFRVGLSEDRFIYVTG